MRRVMVVLLALWAGCGDNDVAQGEIKSGSRLRARYFVGAEGDRIFRDWFDSQLGVTCSWTGGDRPSCLPTQHGTAQFRDPACTQPVIDAGIVDPSERCSAPQPYLTVTRHGCVDAVVDEVWTVDPATFSLTEVYDHDPLTGACTPRTLEGPTVFAGAGVAVPLDRFVAGRVVDAGHGRIRTRTIAGDDGSLAPGDAFDTELGAGCDLDPQRGCVPRGHFAGLAIDDGCDRPVVSSLTACEPPVFISMPQTDPPSLFERGELITSDPEEVLDLFNMSFIVVGEGWSCAPVSVTLRPGYSLWSAGAVVSPDRFAAVEVTAGDGARLQPSWRMTGTHRELISYRDALIDVPCWPTNVNGTWRCLPALHGAWGDFFFADPVCLDPIALMFDYGDVESTLPAISTAVDEATCDLRWRGHERGAARAPGTYYWMDQGTCVPWTHDGGTPPAAFEVGDEVGFERFAELTLITE